jgi:nicotinamide-nucleotide amidase
MTLAELLGLDGSALATLVARLRRGGRTVATAESLTAGLLTATLTEIPGSSAVVRGGFVVYATDLKASLAGVDGDLLARHGAVHPEVARQLARGARERCAATVGIGLTGVAGPDPQDGRPAGTVFVALDHPDGTLDAELRPGDFAVVDRPSVRAAAVRAALGLLEQIAG